MTGVCFSGLLIAIFLILFLTFIINLVSNIKSPKKFSKTAFIHKGIER